MKRKFVDLRVVLMRFLHFRRGSGNQIQSVENVIINDREGISSYILLPEKQMNG